MIDEKEYAKVIAKNLRQIMYERQKTQADVARDLHISKATISSWMNGTRTPKMANIDMLCRYFNCTRSDLMEIDKSTKPAQISEEQAELIKRAMTADPRDVSLLLDFMKRLEDV